jgi:hypothetical protein
LIASAGKFAHFESAGQLPRPDFYEASGVMSSGCWRGYVGEWEIEAGHLRLRDICSLDGESSHLQLVFPTASPPIVATWFSGTLDLVGVVNLLTGEVISPTAKGMTVLVSTRLRTDFVADIVSGTVVDCCAVPGESGWQRWGSSQ